MFDSIWFVLFLPVLGALICAFHSQELGRRGTHLVACSAILGAFLAAARNLASYTAPRDVVAWTWMQLPLNSSRVLDIPFGAYVDGLTVVMLTMITGVAFLIHVYSTEYMSDEPNYGRFFASLNFFVATMVCLVLSNNLATLLIGWGGVGYASYSLIGFYSEKPSAVSAARKAFLINVVGDVGLMLAIFFTAQLIGSVRYVDLFNPENLKLLAPHAFEIGSALLLAAYAKSAQLPLHTWLPDAMEGPTPVSALIHAATMVTAGVYLLVRCKALFALSPTLMDMVALFGALTAIVAACSALVQTDLKRILAYSTMSQLGYMFMAAGVGAYGAAIFHLVTHAFFKALLFLAAGAVIHALHGEQDIRRMGGLRTQLPVTHAVFLIGSLALAGIPPLAGFVSKEEILTGVYTSHHGSAMLLFGIGIVTAAMTAYYTMRAYCLTFLGTSRNSIHLHRPGGTMEMPLLLLAFLTVTGGLLKNMLNLWLGCSETGHAGAHLMVIALVAAGGGVLLGWNLHRGGQDVAWSDSVKQVLQGCFGIDSVYCGLFAANVRRSADRLARSIDPIFSRLAPDFLGRTGLQSSQVLTLMQSGNLRLYALAVTAGVAIFILFTFICAHQMGKLGGG